MKNLREVVCMYFQKVSSYNILSEELNYKMFSKNDFDALARKELIHLSETETDQLYSYLKSKTDFCEEENCLNVFRALKRVAGEYLMIREAQPVCRYDKLLGWRKLSKCIGEDLPICAFLADRTQKYAHEWRDFEWNIVIGHDNMQLNRIMQRGISDNHFHLFGSAPSFKLIWIHLMNQVESGRYRNGLKAIDKKKCQTRNHYSSTYKEDSLEQMQFQAALIRVVLFYYINSAKGKNTGQQARILDKLQEIRNALKSRQKAEIYRGNLQIYIERLKVMKELVQMDKSSDYANLGHSTRSIYHEFEGERALLYQMFLGQINGEPIPDILLNWFYAYLVIQVKFREELLQVNDTIGFENFNQYTTRKNKFLYTSADDKKMIQHAVRGSFEGGNLKSLEVRMGPSETARENSIWIKTCDNHIKECLRTEELNQIYYVLHFPKQKDEKLEIKKGNTGICRHEKFRNKLNKKADALIQFRELYPKEAERVLGIDACAQEIGCRPEVFASVFRRLTNHVFRAPLFGSVKQWKITYHVGEDWMDVADGLRAVDEAVLFLNMKNGDRLGHATVLGIDVKKWYKKKKHSLFLPLQDYLDNIVWLYHKLIEFDIMQCETLKGMLLSEYDRCFKKLYQKCIEVDFSDYGINTYYEAWKLRGDNPVLYQTGKYENPYFRFFPSWINYEIIRGEEIRKKREPVRLLYYYHYSAEIRSMGECSEEVPVSSIYVEGIEKVQKAMQHFIAQKGICVETNPSSNYLISTMEKYEEHPISNLYNLGLTLDKEEVSECAQIHVSINTDDKGIFYTSLENEYALMGCAMERMRDEQGKTKYQKQMVYDWLEHIRRNGNQQSFLEYVRDIEENGR